MKNIIIALLAIMLLAACKKENQFPSKEVTVSRPTINLNGEQVIILNVGDTYTEQGATYYDSVYGDSGNAISGTEVSTSEEGFFIITYSATNQYGFEGTGIRLVAVTAATDALDVSGTYLRAATGLTADVSKVGRGVFLTSNAGGNGLFDPVYFMFTGDSTMVMPSQYLVNSIAQAEFEDPAYDFTTNSYSYTIHAAGYADNLRTFVKQ